MGNVENCAAARDIEPPMVLSATSMKGVMISKGMGNLTCGSC